MALYWKTALPNMSLGDVTEKIKNKYQNQSWQLDLGSYCVHTERLMDLFSQEKVTTRTHEKDLQVWNNFFLFQYRS